MISNRLQNLTEEQVDEYLKQCEGFLKHQHLDRDETIIRLELLDEAILTLEHARKFIISREKMHPSGVELYDECIAKLKGEEFPKPSRKDGKEPCGECHLQPGEVCDICGAIND